ncbi:dihydrolipoyl dehydrogenase [Alkaliphilus crotonatoxidans]
MKVAVLGGGPGGYVCAIRLAQLGAEVTLIEKERLGGTCLNVGCIPTKVLLHTAEIYETLHREGQELGIHIPKLALDWAALQGRKEQIVNQLVGGVEGLIQSNGIRHLKGTGRLIDQNHIQVELTHGELERVYFDKAVIATGSEPKIVPIPGVNQEGVITSTEALSLNKVPESICIIGGGVIGCEFAGIYNAFGAQVTIVEAMPRLMAALDQDIVEVFQNQILESGAKIHVDSKVQAIQRADNKLAVQVETPRGNITIEAEKVLMAIGRSPVIKNLGLEEVDILIDRGAIKVDPRTMQTSLENIYAIGDCNGGTLLAHVASAEGVLAAESIMGIRPTITFKAIPSGVYTKPELASVGLTEAEAQKQGYQVRTGIFPLYANGKSLIMGEGNGLVKFVVDAATDEILGLHMAGPRATDLIVEGALALRLEATIDEIISTIHGHPTVGEALHEAAHAVHGTALHLPK